MKNLSKGIRKGLTDGLRNFIRVDNNRALDVGEPHRGTESSEAKSSGRGSAEEVRTSKAYIDVNHIKPERWGLLADGQWLLLFVEQLE